MFWYLFVDCVEVVVLLVNDVDWVLVWLDGIVGVIIYCDIFCVVVLVCSVDIVGLGIDVELVCLLFVDIYCFVLCEVEYVVLSELLIVWYVFGVILIFCVKEVLYKVLYLIIWEFLDF